MHPIVKIAMARMRIIWGDIRRVGAFNGAHRKNTSGRVIIESLKTILTGDIRTVDKRILPKHRGALQKISVDTKAAT